jgi:AcrR family transcriptional regulator
MTTSSIQPCKPRWRRRPQKRPEEILDAAMRVFSRRGLHKTNLEEVAREAGISKGTIYLYFKSKEDLFIAAAQRVIPPLQELAPALQQGRRDGEGESFSRSLHRLAQIVYRRCCTLEYRAFFSMVMAETLRYPEWGELCFRRVVLELNRRVAEIFAQAMATGECRPVDPVLASRAFAGMFLALALSQEHLGGKKLTPFSETKIVNTLTGIFLQGLSPHINTTER